MVRVDLVREKVRQVRATLALLAARLPADANALRADHDALDLVAFRVYLVMQHVVDIAAHVIADEGWGPAPSLRDHFAVLEQRGVLDAPLVAPLSSAIKVRNLIAHGYVAVDPMKLHAAAVALAPVAERFCAVVMEWAERTKSP